MKRKPLRLESLEPRVLLAADSFEPRSFADHVSTMDDTSGTDRGFSSASQSNVYPAINLAKFQQTTADSSNGVKAAEATDGIVSNDSRWFPNHGGSHWLRVDLAAEYPVGSSQLFLGKDNSLTVGSFDLQYHNGSSWQTIVSITDNTATDLNLVFPQTIVADQFRFFTSESTARIKEFALYPPNGGLGFPLGTDLNINLASQRGPEATSVFQNYHAINAVDGYVDDGSRWLSSGANGSHSLEVEIPTTHQVGSVHLYSGYENSGGTTESPLSSFTVEYLDGANWRPVPGGTVSSGSMTGNSVTANTSSELIVDFSSPVLADKLRINFTAPYGRIRELVVLPANVKEDGTSGYPVGTSVRFQAKPETAYADFGDAWHRIASRTDNNSLISGTDGSSQADSTTEDDAKHFQLLYSYARDAYRLRNRDTGKAIEVKDASLLAGAAIVEGDYSAAPHQLWRLEATSNGYAQFVNVWSGMVLQVDEGSPAVVTQQPKSSSPNPPDSQEWTALHQEPFFKKGTGGWVGQYGTGWAYDWSRGDRNMPIDQFYAPMQHREGWPNLGTLHSKYHDWNNDVHQSYLLGFNEPDRPDQANMPVSRALELWPRLMALDIPLISPAPAQGGEDWWLTPFMDRHDDQGYRTDYAAGHWYSGPNVDSLMNHINDIQNDGNGRSVWLTEFSVVDWSGGSGNWSEESNYNFILEFLWRAKTKSNLDKYALFLFSGNSPAEPWTLSNPRSNFFSGGNLTPFGKAYAAWNGDTTLQDRTSYVIHNRSARHRMRNEGLGVPTEASIRTEDASVQWQLQDAGGGKKYITSVVDGSRLTYDGSRLRFSPAGTTGSDVEWEINQEQYGWHNIVHAATNEYLRLNRVNNSSNAPISQTFEMVSAGVAAGNRSTDWWFVQPYDAVDSNSAGDFDGDFVLGCGDIDRLTAEIASGRNDVDFDLTGDSVVDLADRDTWLALGGAANLPSGRTYLYGDANLDGVVDVSDFNIWNSNKFTNEAAWCSGDFTADGWVDVSDFNRWNENKFLSTADSASFDTGPRRLIIQGGEQISSATDSDDSTPGDSESLLVLKSVDTPAFAKPETIQSVSRPIDSLVRHRSTQDTDENIDVRYSERLIEDVFRNWPSLGPT